MLNRLIGKNVEITVAFAGSVYNTGPAPICYYGILKEVGEEYCAVSLSYARPNCTIMQNVFNVSATGENRSGDIYIKKEYIITCCELQ